MIEKIQSIQSNLLINLQESEIERHITVEFECPFPVNFLNKNILEHELFRDNFKQLMELTGPVLYWFEISSNHTAKQIIESFRSYHKQIGSRPTPALKKGVRPDSQCLYVGKAKRYFYGRVIQHLGFEQGGSSQGLQLYHWANDIGLKVKVHAYEFSPSMIELISVMEIELAKQMNPLLGKH
jgi:hypothetical protein